MTWGLGWAQTQGRGLCLGLVVPKRLFGLSFRENHTRTCNHCTRLLSSRLADLTTQGTDWPVRLGRIDSSDGGAAGRIPLDDAPVSEIVGFMKQLGAKPGGFCGSCLAQKPWTVLHKHNTLIASSCAVVVLL